MKKAPAKDNPAVMEDIISLAKRRGFIYQGSEIYGGLSGTWDYGPLGVALKDNIRQIWWKQFVLDRDDMYGMDAAILMNQKVWQATGHATNFSDPLTPCLKCKKQFRTDHLNGATKCPECGGNFGPERKFNMMFKTNVGPEEGGGSLSYLRPETAQGMFVNFKNVLDSFHPKLPFGLAQVGKAFRNEISPRDFTFRAREFEQMEIEYFVKPEGWEKIFEHFVSEMRNFISAVGISADKVHEKEIGDADRAFYSKRTIDFEFDFPFGQSELYGLAYRTDYDLKAHETESGKTLVYTDTEANETLVPHCIEPSFGLDRTVLAVLSSAFKKEKTGEDERIVLKFNPKVAPVLLAVSPLLRNKPKLVEKAQEIYKTLKKEFGRVMFDDNGNIGKRYRRQDEIGTPFCITVDFDTIEKDDTVTVRDRDTMEQVRIRSDELVSFFKNKLA
ncbi:MAG: glycine--tRNA ligase [Candidatus Paceibacterota bacterium]|jgi:glycyl-tRNA synthetase